MSNLLLPPEIWDHVFSFLSPPFAFVTRFVCKAWSQSVVLKDKIKRLQPRDKCDKKSSPFLDHVVEFPALFKWGRSKGAPWSTETCEWAATKNRETLEWAVANGCPWDENVYIGPGMNGDLDTIKWLREKGAPWNQIVCTSPIIGGHYNVLEWYERNGAPPLDGVFGKLLILFTPPECLVKLLRTALKRTCKS